MLTTERVCFESFSGRSPPHWSCGWIQVNHHHRCHHCHHCHQCHFCHLCHLCHFCHCCHHCQIQIQTIGAERLHRSDTGCEHFRELCRDGTLGGREGDNHNHLYLIMALSISPLTYIPDWKMSIPYWMGRYFSSARTTASEWRKVPLPGLPSSAGIQVFLQLCILVQVSKCFFKCCVQDRRKLCRSSKMLLIKNDNENNIWRSPCAQKGWNLCSARKHDMAWVLHQDDHCKTT